VEGAAEEQLLSTFTGGKGVKRRLEGTANA
jgi:hypothetical protein